MATFIRPLQPEEVEFDCECQEETEQLNRAFDDEECIAQCREKLLRGNTWGWCEVTVRARWNGFQGKACLGGCSYDSKKDFIANSGCYDDMCMEALDDLSKSLCAAAQMLEPLVSRESVDRWLVAKVQES